MRRKSITLGEFLHVAREKKALSLRSVERSTEISNAYLSQLESGKIKKPSPTVLHQLSQLYEMQYAVIMKLAGYPVPGDLGKDSYATRLGPITNEEEKALQEYLEFLRSKRLKASKR